MKLKRIMSAMSPNELTAFGARNEELMAATVNNSALSEAEKIETIAMHFEAIMRTLGLDTSKGALRDTPRRVACMYVRELFCGLVPGNKPKVTLFDNTHGYEQMVLERNIPFFSCCEHHFVPIHGEAHVAYISSGRIIGLSKINRIVHHYARQPQVQERLTQQIAAELSDVLQTEDVAVKLDASHFCVISRGVSDQGTRTSTLYLGGCFKAGDRRAEFLHQL